MHQSVHSIVSHSCGLVLLSKCSEIFWLVLQKLAYCEWINTQFYPTTDKYLEALSYWFQEKNRYTGNNPCQITHVSPPPPKKRTNTKLLFSSTFPRYLKNPHLYFISVAGGGGMGTMLKKYTYASYCPYTPKRSATHSSMSITSVHWKWTKKSKSFANQFDFWLIP